MLCNIPVEAYKQTPHTQRQGKGATHGDEQYIDHHPVAQARQHEDESALGEQLGPVADCLQVYTTHHRETCLTAVEPDERQIATHH